MLAIFCKLIVIQKGGLNAKIIISKKENNEKAGEGACFIEC
jgi:hypothetical protein